MSSLTLVLIVQLQKFCVLKKETNFKVCFGLGWFSFMFGKWFLSAKITVRGQKQRFWVRTQNAERKTQKANANLGESK